MRTLSRKNTLWRDVYGRAWAISLAVAVLVHATLFFFLPSGIADRLHEALIPSPTVFVVAAGPGSELEVLTLRTPVEEQPEVTPPPAPEPEEEVVEVQAAEDVAVETTIATVTGPPTDSEEGRPEGVPGGEGDAEPTAGGGGGAVSPPRPLHLVVPKIPSGLDKKRARGTSVHLLVQVLPDGTVGEVRIEKGSRFAVLDTAALVAAQQMRYLPAQRGGMGVTQWTRAEMRF